MSKALFGFLTVSIVAWYAYSLGKISGTYNACSSVKMEWVVDKCMKVTREEVK